MGSVRDFTWVHEWTLEGWSAERDVGEAVAPTLNLRSFGKAGGKVSVEDRSGKRWD